MSDIVGMDIEQVREMGRRMQAEADRLRSQVVAPLDNLMGHIPAVWTGPDAVRFRDAWVGRERSLVGEAAERLYGLGQAALANAADQERTSAGTGQSAGGVVRVSGFVAVGNPRADGRDVLVSALVATDTQEQIGRDEIEVRALPNGRFVVVLPGVTDLSDGLHAGAVVAGAALPVAGAAGALVAGGGATLSEWLGDSHYASVRDMQGAIHTALDPGGKDAYAEQVKQALRNAGVPAASEVMLVGHSYGGYAAMHLAADPSFNQQVPGDDYSVNVTDVVSFGAGTAHELADIPASTNALVVGHRADLAYLAERNLDAVQTLANGGVGAGNHHVVEFGGNPEAALIGGGHDPIHYEGFLYDGEFDRGTGTFLDGVGSRYGGTGESIIMTVPANGDPGVRP